MAFLNFEEEGENINLQHGALDSRNELSLR